jgi:hypothetical protein
VQTCSYGRAYEGKYRAWLESRRQIISVIVLLIGVVLLLQKLQPLQSEYVDRRFDGTKVGAASAVSCLLSHKTAAAAEQ